MNIVIVGGGGIGSQLIELLLKSGSHNVVVIDKDETRCKELAGKYDAVAIYGDITQEGTLDDVEINKVDVVVATTNDDATNLMVCSLAMNKGVNYLVSVVNQEESKPLYVEKGVKMVRSPHMVMAEQLYRAIIHPIVKEYMILGKYAEIFRLPIDSRSKLIGKTISQVNVPGKRIIIAVERDHKFIIPDDEDELCDGDIITVVAHKDYVK
jgi:trk system potassium uptake protein TrkA